MSDKTSLYAAYLRERTNDEILEVKDGFATFRFVEDGRTVYIVDIYVTPEARRNSLATALADDVANIARSKGCTSMIGTVQPSAKGSTGSLKALLAYGMRLDNAGSDYIIFRKDL